MGANARISGDSLIAYFMPLVTGATKAGWEAYAAENHHHYLDTFMRENHFRAKQDERFGGPPPADEGRKLEDVPPALQYNPILRDINGTATGDGPFFPYWQTAPAIPMVSLINFDVGSHPLVYRSFEKSLQSHRAVLDIAAGLNASDGDNGATNLFSM